MVKRAQPRVDADRVGRHLVVRGVVRRGRQRAARRPAAHARPRRGPQRRRACSCARNASAARPARAAEHDVADDRGSIAGPAARERARRRRRSARPPTARRRAAGRRPGTGRGRPRRPRRSRGRGAERAPQASAAAGVQRREQPGARDADAQRRAGGRAPRTRRGPRARVVGIGAGQHGQRRRPPSTSPAKHRHAVERAARRHDARGADQPARRLDADDAVEGGRARGPSRRCRCRARTRTTPARRRRRRSPSSSRPTMRLGSATLEQAPYGERVPTSPVANWSRFVLPTGSAPAASSRRTAAALALGPVGERRAGRGRRQARRRRCCP